MTRVVRWCAVAVLLAPTAVPAQPRGAANREALKKLDFLVGKWQGTTTFTIDSEHTIKMTADVQFKLDREILLVERTGRGKIPGKNEQHAIFDTLAVISYDSTTNRYQIREYRPLGGPPVDAELTLPEKGKGFVWGSKLPFDHRELQTRQTMTLTDKGEWHEVGEHSLDGTKWTKNIETTLTRVKE